MTIGTAIVVPQCSLYYLKFDLLQKLDEEFHLLRLWAYASFLHPAMRHLPKQKYQQVIQDARYPFYKMRAKYDDFDEFWATIESDMIQDMIRLSVLLDIEIDGGYKLHMYLFILHNILNILYSSIFINTLIEFNIVNLCVMN